MVGDVRPHACSGVDPIRPLPLPHSPSLPPHPPTLLAAGCTPIRPFVQASSGQRVVSQSVRPKWSFANPVTGRNPGCVYIRHIYSYLYVVQHKNTHVIWPHTAHQLPYIITTGIIFHEHTSATGPTVCL